MNTTTIQERPIAILELAYEVDGNVAQGEVIYEDEVKLTFRCRGTKYGVRTRIADAAFDIPITSPSRAFALTKELRARGVFKEIAHGV